MTISAIKPPYKITRVLVTDIREQMSGPEIS